MYFVIAVMVCVALAIFPAVWAYGIYSCANNTRLTTDERARWMFFILVIPFFAAAVYLYQHRHDPAPVLKRKPLRTH